MEVIIQKDAERAANLVARIVVQAIKEDPKLVLGLATGRTMERVYAELIRFYREKKVSFSSVSSFNLDEYIGLPLDHPESFHTYMDKKFFSLVDIKRSRTHIPNGSAKDLERESKRYERSIKAAGGIDLQILGLGMTGHIAFNEPFSSLSSRTRPKLLAPDTLQQNASAFGSLSKVPRRAITVGVGTILDSDRCIMMVTGKEKAETLRKAVEGPVCSLVPASALQYHPRCIVVADEAAASKLEHKKYHQWVFENEPEWEAFR